MRLNLFSNPKRAFMEDMRVYFDFTDALKDVTDTKVYSRSSIIDWIKIVLKFLNALKSPALHPTSKITRDRNMASEIASVMKVTAIVSYLLTLPLTLTLALILP